METLQLFRTCAELPYAQVDITDSGNLRLTVWSGSEKDADKDVIVLNRREARDVIEAMGIMADNYLPEVDN